MHTYCDFKVRSRKLKHKSYKRLKWRLSSPLNDHIDGLPCCVTLQLKMVSIFWTHTLLSLWHMSIPCHISLKCLIKKSNHVNPTSNLSHMKLVVAIEMCNISIGVSDMSCKCEDQDSIPCKVWAWFDIWTLTDTYIWMVHGWVWIKERTPKTCVLKREWAMYSKFVNHSRHNFQHNWGV